MNAYLEEKTEVVLKELVCDPDLGCFVDSTLDLPRVFQGSGPIRLIVLGQDPTVKNPRSRARVKTVLNLDKPGSLRSYLAKICKGLGLDLNQHIYATNYLKSFFVEPPTQIEEIDILDLFGPIWQPILAEELGSFPEVPVVTLGQPLLSKLVYKGGSALVRDFWGYTPSWKTGETRPFRYLEPGENLLDRLVFPFPHQPSIRKRFYRDRLDDYLGFVRSRSFDSQREFHSPKRQN